MEKTKQQLKVDAIENGTVIDHIPAGKVLQVAEILNLNTPYEVLIGMNFPSKKTGRKDIIKIENRELNEGEVSSLALIAPQATIAIIKNYQVVRKLPVQTPKTIERLIVCPNPKCVTNVLSITTRFTISEDKEMQVRCLYCEKKYLVDEVKIKV